MAELFGIMSLLDAEEFGDEDAFLERYGGGRRNPMPDPEQVHALQVRGHDIRTKHTPLIPSWM